MMRWLTWFVFVAVVAAGTHWAAIRFTPDLIMARAMAKMATRGVNTITHGERATAASRAIVAPSPDLLYSTCVYDLSRAPLKITTAAPENTYWSVALYASNTDNFFVLNDVQAKSQPATIILVASGQTLPPQPEGVIVVAAPTTKGVVLFRTLVNDDTREPELDRQRRAAKCEPM